MSLGRMAGRSGEAMHRADDTGTQVAVSESEPDAQESEVLRLARALAEAEAGCRRRDELLSIASHALRTPLTAILGWVNLLRASELDPATSARAIDVIERNARRQADLIADLIDATRILTGRLRLNRGRVDLKGTVDTALAGARPAAEAKDVRLHAALDPAAAAVSGDSDRLQQVVSILLSNAVKFSGVHGRVDVRLERVGPFAELRVRDDGAGIPPALLPHLFDRLPQGSEGGPSEDDRNRGQLGLGLSIARHLAQLHGGGLSATSDGAGRGATFTLRVPLRGLEVDEGPGDETAPAPASAPRLEGLRVLVVGDDGGERDAMIRTLALRGGEVTTAGTCEEALRELIATAPDAIVVDLEMHGEQGYELIGRARAMPAENGGRTPAVAVTSQGRAEDRVRTLRAGFQIHVAKPVPPLALAAVVASLATRTPHRRSGAPDPPGREETS
jgi:signal transduction histidine kinase/CheY-like chemotaxis protein